jgi:predicted ribosome quality control (RQC) complex YloA/Tae2 family protein
LPKLPYVPPPPLDRPDPRRTTTAEVETLLRGQLPSGLLAPFLVRAYRGISPQMAREIAHQATSDPDVTIGALPDESPNAIARETRRLFEPLLTGAWSPVVYREDDGTAAAFAPVPMAHLAARLTAEPATSISRAAEMARGPGGATPQRHAQRRERLAASIGDARDRLAARHESLRSQQRKAEQAEQLREWGELIYAYLWKIHPGDTVLDADGVKVPIDASLSPKENAQEYFERYRKAQSAEGRLPDMIEQVEVDLAYLDQLRTQVNQAVTFAEIESLTAEWEERRGNQPARITNGTFSKSPASRRPRPLVDQFGNAVYIGRSGRQNDQVTFVIAGPNDTWLHARGVPGSHVIVRWNNPNGDEDEATLDAAASLAAFYSSARESGRAEVDITRRRHVRKIKGAGPGMVTYRNERTVSVKPSDEQGLNDVIQPPANPNEGH